MSRTIDKDKRKLSLPDIKHSKHKKPDMHSSYSNNVKPHARSNLSDKSLKHVQSKEIGQSFISFNVNQSSAKNNANIIMPG